MPGWAVLFLLGLALLGLERAHAAGDLLRVRLRQLLHRLPHVAWQVVMATAAHHPTRPQLRLALLQLAEANGAPEAILVEGQAPVGRPAVVICRTPAHVAPCAVSLLVVLAAVQVAVGAEDVGGVGEGAPAQTADEVVRVPHRPWGDGVGWEERMGRMMEMVMRAYV